MLLKEIDLRMGEASGQRARPPPSLAPTHPPAHPRTHARTHAQRTLTLSWGSAERMARYSAMSPAGVEVACAFTYVTWAKGGEGCVCGGGGGGGL